MIFNIKVYSLVILLVCALLSGCESKKDIPSEEEQVIESVERVPIAEFSPKFQSLAKSDSGIFRGVDFKTTLEKLSYLEDTSAVVEKTARSVSYSIHLDSLEEGEVLYYFNENNTVHKIEVNIYPNGPESRAELFKEFTHFFNGKYGLPSSEIEEVKIWKIDPENLSIEMRMLGNTKVHDIQIDINKLDPNI